MFKRSTSFKRDTLIRNLKGAVGRIPSLDLPANVVAIYAFGGILREKELLHDFDMVILYRMTGEQKERWETFRGNFSTISLDNGESHRGPIYDLLSEFKPYLDDDIPLRDAVKVKKLSEMLRRHKINPQWASCFSWTEVLNNPLVGIFVPEIKVVIQRILLGRGFRGLQALVEEHDEFMAGKGRLAPKNYELAWSVAKPDIEGNLGNRNIEKKTEYIIKELDFFMNQKIPDLVE